MVHDSDLPHRALYRAMEVDENGQPVVGPYASALGVRMGKSPWDILVDKEGMVEPAKQGKGGMSVTPDTPFNLHNLHKPPELGGEGSYPVWEMDVLKIGPLLRYRETSGTHGLLEPAHRMPIKEFQGALAATRDHWTRALG